MKKQLNVPCHIEFKTTNLGKYKMFYDMFNWRIIKSPIPGYNLLKFKDDFSVGGAVLLVEEKQEKANSSPLIYIRVEDIDSTLESLVKRGAEVQQTKIIIPKVGEWATFFDIDNNLVGLWKEEI